MNSYESFLENYRSQLYTATKMLSYIKRSDNTDLKEKCIDEISKVYDKEAVKCIKQCITHSEIHINKIADVALYNMNVYGTEMSQILNAIEDVYNAFCIANKDDILFHYSMGHIDLEIGNMYSNGADFTLITPEILLKRWLEQNILNKDKSIALSFDEIEFKLFKPDIEICEFNDIDICPNNCGAVSHIFKKITLNISILKYIRTTDIYKIMLSYEYEHPSGGTNGQNISYISNDNCKTFELY
jgi:hypothetical protein